MFNRPGSSQSRGPHRLATLQVHYGRLRTEGHTKVDRDFVDQVLDAAARVVAGGAISGNGHGNVSLRVPGAEEMYYTAAPSLKGLRPDGIVRVALDGTLLEGNLPPIQGAVVGAVLMQSLKAGMVTVGLDSPMQDVAIGCVLVFAVGLDTIVRRRAT